MGNTGVLGGRVKRGIEPIVAAILLIVITVVAAVLLYIWFNGYLSSTTSKVSQVSVPEELQIVNVAVVYSSSGSPSSIVAYIQNVGSIPATINQAYVLNVTTGNVICAISSSSMSYNIPPSSPTASTSTTVPASGLTVPSGTAAELILSLSSCSLALNTYYVLKLVTARGTQVTYQFST
ncbi:MAG: archaellin/type IV pilin N-terminal domain-containing protein [Caldivirga sp.]